MINQAYGTGFNWNILSYKNYIVIVLVKYLMIRNITVSLANEKSLKIQWFVYLRAKSVMVVYQIPHPVNYVFSKWPI